MPPNTLNMSSIDTTPFFDFYYNNAKLNSILIMDCDGTILNVNEAFTDNFGYSNEDINGQNFSILFNKRDKEKNRPQLELETVLTQGNAMDENYIIDKDGVSIWCTGESLLVFNKEGEKYIVKDIVNLQGKKHLQLLLTETEELLERIFQSSKDTSMMILDGSMKIISVNAAFLHLFEIKDAPLSGSSLPDLHHPFWSSPAIRGEIRNIIVTNQSPKQKEFLLETSTGEKKTIRLDAKVIDTDRGTGKKVFIIIQEIIPQPIK